MTLVVAGQATARQLLVHTAALPLVKAPGAARQMSRAAAGEMGMCQTKGRCLKRLQPARKTPCWLGVRQLNLAAMQARTRTSAWQMQRQLTLLLPLGLLALGLLTLKAISQSQARWTRQTQCSSACCLMCSWRAN